MLGLQSGLHYESPVSEFSPIDISNCVGWWDFTDTSTMYTNWMGGDHPSSDGDDIARIDNKAYTLQNNTKKAYGKFLHSQFGSIMTPIYRTGDSDASKRPPNETALTGIPHAHFEERTSAGGSVINSRFLYGDRTVGNVDTNTFTESRTDYDKMTQFYVYRVKTPLSSHSYLRENLVSIYGYDTEYTGILPYLFSRQIFYYRSWGVDMHATANNWQSGDPGWPSQRMFRAGLTSHNWTLGDQGSGGLATDKFNFVTVKVDGGKSTTQSSPYLRPGRMFKNGVSSNGIDASDYTDIVDTQDHATSGDGYIYPHNYLNVGVWNHIADQPTTFQPAHLVMGDWFDINGFTGETMISALPGGTDYYVKDTNVYEVLMYTRALNDQEIANVHNYLIAKYGDPTSL